MKLRDVLQTEIWSKQTSQKILKIGGISFALLFLSGVTVAWGELKWLTPAERSAARAALADVDALQQGFNINGVEYNRLRVNADRSVQKAQGAAWTLRDKNVASSLDGYLFLTEIQHDEPRHRAELAEFNRRHPGHTRIETQSQQDQEDQTSKKVEEFLHEVLHRVLD